MSVSDYARHMDSQLEEARLRVIALELVLDAARLAVETGRALGQGNGDRVVRMRHLLTIEHLADMVAKAEETPR
jgi:hypothetical protein